MAKKNDYNIMNTGVIVKRVVIVIIIVSILTAGFALYKRMAYDAYQSFLIENGAEAPERTASISLTDVRKIKQQAHLATYDANYKKYYQTVLVPAVELQDEYCQKSSFNTEDSAARQARSKKIIDFDVFKCSNGKYSYTYISQGTKFWAGGQNYLLPPKFIESKEY